MNDELSTIRMSSFQVPQMPGSSNKGVSDAEILPATDSHGVYALITVLTLQKTRQANRHMDGETLNCCSLLSTVVCVLITDALRSFSTVLITTKTNAKKKEQQ